MAFAPKLGGVVFDFRENSVGSDQGATKAELCPLEANRLTMTILNKI